MENPINMDDLGVFPVSYIRASFGLEWVALLMAEHHISPGEFFFPGEG